ncbi:hypothetical protein BGX29_002798, partial [Mortierella sp. GBA35]
MAAIDSPAKTLLEKALLTDSTDSGPSAATGNDLEIEMLVISALRKLVDTFSNVDDQTEPCDPTSEGGVTELTEAEVVLASGDSAGISVDSTDELGIDSAQDPSAEPGEDPDINPAVFLKAEPTADTTLE